MGMGDQRTSIDPFLSDLIAPVPASAPSPPPPPPPSGVAVARPGVTAATVPVTGSPRREADSSGAPRTTPAELWEAVRPTIGQGWRLFRLSLRIVRRAWLLFALIGIVIGAWNARGVGGATTVDAGSDGVINAVAPSALLVDIPGYRSSHRPDVRDLGMPWEWNNVLEEHTVGRDVRQITNGSRFMGALIALSVLPEKMEDEAFRAELLDKTVGGRSERSIGDNEVYMGAVMLDDEQAVTVSTFYENQFVIAATLEEEDALRIMEHILSKAP